eukprot:4658504-Prymnesium_polylepis.1
MVPNMAGARPPRGCRARWLGVLLLLAHLLSLMRRRVRRALAPRAGAHVTQEPAASCTAVLHLSYSLLSRGAQCPMNERLSIPSCVAPLPHPSPPLSRGAQCPMNDAHLSWLTSGLTALGKAAVPIK